MPQSNMDILLIEDGRPLRDAVRAYFTRVGHRVHAVASGAEALDTAARLGSTLDVAIVDLSLPDIQGDVLARELRSLLPDSPLIFMTGLFEDHPLVKRAMVCSNSLVVHKPLSLKSLDALVRERGMNSHTQPGTNLSNEAKGGSQ